MPWSAVAGAVVSSVVSSALAPDPSMPSGVSAQADPFASQRPQYQAMLQQLMTNPSYFQGTPDYQFSLQQGLGAVDRNAAASGQLTSGNRLQALTAYGSGLASQNYMNYANLLGNLAGTQAGSPVAAANLSAQQNQAAAQGMGAIGNALGGLASSYVQNYYSPSTTMATGNSAYDPYGAYSGYTSSSPSYSSPTIDWSQSPSTGGYTGGSTLSQNFYSGTGY